MKTTTATAPRQLSFLTFILMALLLCLAALPSHARDRDDRRIDNSAVAEKVQNDPYYRSKYSRNRERLSDPFMNVGYDKEDKGKGNKHGKGHGRWDDNDRSDKKGDRDDKDIKWNGSRNTYNYNNNTNVIVRINDYDRAKIRSYIREDYFAKHCPPGLAKKRNGCTPPGHAKRYVVGQPLPGDIVIVRPPEDLVVLLGPPPRGAFYAQVDQDVLLISEAGHHILDAVTLLSAVN